MADQLNVYEVEPLRSWQVGAQQAFAYAGMSGLIPNLAIFGRGNYVPIYSKIRDKMPGLRLWIWDVSYSNWQICGSLITARSLGR